MAKQTRIPRANTPVGDFPTSKENIALDIIFGIFGETRYVDLENAADAQRRYEKVASLAPKLTALHADVNKLLSERATAGYAPFQICYFKEGHNRYAFENYPTSLSLETVRKAWFKSGMRELQKQLRRSSKLTP